MASCNVCQKSFKSKQALHQHNEDSPAHRPIRCEPCNKPFQNLEALAQHNRDSPAHKNNYTCQPCNTPFPSSAALAKHVKDSPNHTTTVSAPRPKPTTTPPAGPHRHTTTTTTTNSAAPPTHHHPCKTCGRTFLTASALSQHTRDAPKNHAAAAAATQHPCPSCPGRSFGSASALAQHVRDAPSHHHAANGASPPPLQRRRDTPLDLFFRSYPSFRYDPAQSPSASFADLRAHMGWHRRRRRNGQGYEEEDPAADEARERYVTALRRELEVWFGGEDDLANWQALCRAVGAVVPAASKGEAAATEKGCERALRGTHVNLVDLLAWAREDEGVRRRGGDDDGRRTVKVFGSVGALAEYCKKTGKWFPLEDVEKAGEQGDGNVVIRHLLRRFTVKRLR
ncbi:Zinc finger protein [Lasiodiplodia theobromae]|uniref:Zinc finger protein n=2 Tax=Lasiodiplodia theobromae TaxID=45133 RepID=A0A5N5DIC3_9PEZI|nr:Zinc finger protein [Lasiodiplodia theobromae]